MIILAPASEAERTLSELVDAYTPADGSTITVHGLDLSKDGKDRTSQRRARTIRALS